MSEIRKKQIPLRLSEKLYQALTAWAEDDFRSVNGQIEFLLTECARKKGYLREKAEPPAEEQTIAEKEDL